MVELDPFSNNIYFTFVSCYSLGRDNVPLYVICLQNSSHLEGLSFNPACSSCWNMVSSLLRWLAGSLKNDYIIQIDDTPIMVEVPEAGFCQLLKGDRGIGQPKGHSATLTEPQWPHGKCGQWLAILVHLDLTVP